MAKGGNQRNHCKTKNQRRDEIERKRDERSHRNTLRKEKQAQEYAIDDDHFKSFRIQLELQGLKMVDVLGDGNCLFRALADQLSGDEHMHGKHRKETVEYMRQNEDEFIPFLEETVRFTNYLKDLASPGTYGGNDSIVAFARNNQADIVIHQLSSPTYIIEGSHLRESGEKVVIHLAYHDYEHYSSVRRLNDAGGGPAYTYHKETDSVATREKEESTFKKETKEEPTKCTFRKNKRVTVCKNAKEAVDESAKEPVSESTKGKYEQNIYELDLGGMDKDVIGGDFSNADVGGDFISEAVEQIISNSGYTDREYVRNAFVENSYNVDSTLTFILQIMCLDDTDDYNETICQASNNGYETNVNNEKKTSIGGSCMTGEACEDISQLGITDISQNNMEGLANDITRQTREDNNLVLQEDLSVSCVPTEKIDNSRKSKCEEEKVCYCSCVKQDGKCNCENNKFEDERRKACNETKRKDAAKNAPIKKPSNRQRKELAKQARKKRRHENRKDSASSEPPTGQAQENDSIKSINI